MSKPTMRPRIHHVIARPLLACVLAAGCGVATATPDDDKLRLLSCDTPNAERAARKAALDWFNVTAETLARDAGQRIAGPVTLGKACLRNVTVAGGFGAMMVHGDICNTRLEDFTEALAAAGTTLDEASATTGPKALPGAVLGKMDMTRRYLVTKGRVDLRTGKVEPGTTPYAFTCTAVQGGPQ